MGEWDQGLGNQGSGNWQSLLGTRYSLFEKTNEERMVSNPTRPTGHPATNPKRTGAGAGQAASQILPLRGQVGFGEER